MTMKKAALATLIASASLLPIQANATTIFSGSQLGFLIPFGVNTHSSTINIAETGKVKNVTFTLSLLAHTAARDLTATVTHGGVTANLFSGVSDLRGLLGNYSFDASAPTLLKNGSGFLVVKPGTYKFTYPVAGTSFLGNSAAGDWKLTISDNRTLGVGLLGEWSVSGTAAVPEPATWAMMILGFGMIGAAMRRRKPSMRVSYAMA